MGSVRLWATLTQRVLYPLYKICVRSTSIDFAENQLSPSSIGFSPLIISHLRLLPQTWVRSSKTCYRFFNLLMTRSLGFGSSKWYFSLFALFKLVFTPPPLYSLSLLHLLTRWPIMQKVRRYFVLFINKKNKASTACLHLISGFFFTPYLGVFFTFPSRYLSTIDQKIILRLRGWSPYFQTSLFSRFTLFFFILFL